MWKNVVQYNTAHAPCMPKTFGYTRTQPHTRHTEYVTLVPFPWQQWLCEGALMLGYKCVTLMLLCVTKKE